MPSAAAPEPPARPDSRSAILAAATAEFAERGLDGVRMEHVARRAGFNKALVYKHFTDKAQLFQAVLEAAFAGRKAVLERQPSGLGDAMAAWSDAAFAAPDYGRLVLREALERTAAEPALADERRRYYAEQIGGVAEAQARGRLPADLDPKYLFLALMSVVCLPAFLPNVTSLVSDADPKSAAFQDDWRDFLRGFAKTLGAPALKDATDDA